MTAGDATPTPLAFTPVSLYELLWQVAAHANLMSEEALTQTPLTPASASLLRAVAAEPGMSIAEISRRIPKTQQTLSQVTARLEKLGLIERRVRNGRGIGLHSTAEGSAMAQQAADLERGVEQHLRNLLGAERATVLTQLLAESYDLLRTPASDA